jgi:hypothetical protein
MFTVIKLGRSRNECRSAGGAHICLENLVGIVKETQDQVEARKIVAQLRRQLRIPREKSGERTGFKRANRVCVETLFGQRGDGFGAEDFQVRVRKSVSEQFDRGQREDKIADRAAADDQDAVQVNSA